MQHGWRQQQYNSILGSGVPGVGGVLSYWEHPTQYDWTVVANTAFGTAGVIGDTSQGIPGWTPLKNNTWKIVSGAAAFTSSATGNLTDILYLSTHLRLNDRIAVQGNQIGAVPYYTLGLGFNPVSGLGYMLRWNQGGPYVQLRRLTGPGAYPATGDVVISQTNLVYTGSQASDWCVLERTVIGHTSKLVISVCPDAGNRPDYLHPRNTVTYYDTNTELAVPGYPFLSSCQVGFNLSSPRFEVSGATQHEFYLDTQYIGKNKANVTVNLIGVNTTWTADTIFSASTGLTINSIVVSDATHAALDVSSGGVNSEIALSGPGGGSNKLQVCTYATDETRDIYLARRLSKVTHIPGMGGTSVDFVVAAGTYGVGYSLDGNYIYICNVTNILKYNLAAALQATIIYAGLSNVRKMITLPDDTKIVSNYGGANYVLLNADDSDGGTWNATALTSCYGLCLFYDNALARNTILTAGWANKNVYQWETNGTLIKTWASGIAGQVSDVAVDSDGQVYVADWSSGTILQYANDGTYLGIVISGLITPHDLTVLQSETLIIGEEVSGRFSAYLLPSARPLGNWGYVSAGEAVGCKVYPLPAPVPA